MTSETLAEASYRLPILGSREPNRPRNQLRDAFEGWLDVVSAMETRDVSAMYGKAARALADRGLRPEPDKVEDLLSCCLEHPRIDDAGLFLSACYNATPDETIVYRGIGIPLRLIGYQLAPCKTLRVPKGVAAQSVGYRSGGTIVVEGTVQDAGYESTGTVLITGSVGSAGYGTNAAGSLTIVSGNVENFAFYTNGLALLTGKTRHVRTICNKGGIVLIGGQSEEPQLGSEESGVTIGVERSRAYLHLGGLHWQHHRQDVDQQEPLVCYVRGVLADFEPGTPVEAQLAAARKLDKKQIRARLRSFLKEGWSYD